MARLDAGAWSKGAYQDAGGTARAGVEARERPEEGGDRRPVRRERSRQRLYPHRGEGPRPCRRARHGVPGVRGRRLGRSPPGHEGAHVVEPAAGFFRRQSGRLVSALTRIFGVHNVALAEDVTQDALCRALSVWRFSGVPDDPAAWLMAVAKNRALDILRHDKTARRFAPELGFLLDSEWTLAPTVIDLFEPRAVTDGELRMMFSCSAPGLPEEAQVALILHILCGFSSAEVAGALLSTEAATAKRIARAKKTL